MKVVSLNAVRENQQIKKGNPDYQKRIAQMDKLDLLTEMMRFQEERSRLGKLTLPLMIRGKILFKALETNAETQELRHLARSYGRHLNYELEARLATHEVTQDRLTQGLTEKAST